MTTSSQITNVSLYVHPERVEEELAALGIGAEVALTPNEVAPFDQMHYYGNEAVGRAAALLGLGADSCVLDIGSGFGSRRATSLTISTAARWQSRCRERCTRPPFG
jgi:hypothetical protein